MLRRQLMFFNTHPYLAPVIMGVVYAKENARSRRDSEDATLTVLKDSMGGAFGAIGDHVIWGTWRPFCAILALAVGALVAFPMRDPRICAEWWVGGFLGLFNFVHLWLRWRGLQRAVHDGPQVVRWVESLHMQLWAAQVRRLGLLLLVCIVLMYFGHWARSNLLVWMMGVFLGVVVMKRWAVSGFVVFYAVCALAIVLSVIGVQ
jgi:mannose/fructose/N-acetylgalactosamine-specific phosphotransferase system component IID